MKYWSAEVYMQGPRTVRHRFYARNLGAAMNVLHDQLRGDTGKVVRISLAMIPEP